MKKINLYLAITAFFALLATGSFAQSAITPAMATVVKSGAVQISADQPLQEVYEISSAGFNFENDQQALAHFKDLNTDHVFYRPALNRGKVMIHLQLNKEPSWTKEQWNAYLKNHKLHGYDTANQSINQN